MTRTLTAIIVLAALAASSVLAQPADKATPPAAGAPAVTSPMAGMMPCPMMTSAADNAGQPSMPMQKGQPMPKAAPAMPDKAPMPMMPKTATPGASMPMPMMCMAPHGSQAAAPPATPTPETHH